MSLKLSSCWPSSRLLYKKETKTPRSLSNILFTPKKVIKPNFPQRRNSLLDGSESSNLDASPKLHSRRSPRNEQSINQSTNFSPNDSTSSLNSNYHKFSSRTILTAKNKTRAQRSSSLFSPTQLESATPQSTNLRSSNKSTLEDLGSYNPRPERAVTKTHSSPDLTSSLGELPNEKPKENPQSAHLLEKLVTQVKSPNLQPPCLEKANAKLMQMKAETLYKQHLFQTCQALKLIKKLQPLNCIQLNEKKINLQKKPGHENKKTVIFDLDETLVHCNEISKKFTPDAVLPIRFVTGEVINAGINIRPYTKECLEYASQNFEVIVFTASHKCYADAVLDYLDPKGDLIHHRFYRDSCIINQGVYIKDLRIFLNRDLCDMIIVDNAAYSFAYQIDNGIPIISWFDDKNDTELLNLINYLKVLQEVKDVREINRETFKLYSLADESEESILNRVKRRVVHRRTRSVDDSKIKE
ncbi:unnamed protein product [Blepharisma stoltei]|uniref:FCP1 homology domain-containing protein n=1 Tax=Blepharisma stoltei TaxID=1481888 RepID=A0AAU9I9G4_9CILI|nr:unnamed protein product [Blepharisma stoltei]